MALTDVYVVTLVQRLMGQTTNQIFTYERLGPTETATGLLAEFQRSVLSPMLAIQSNQVQCVSLTALSLGDQGDFDTVALTQTGLVGAAPMLAFAAFGFSFRPDTRAVGVGGKRVPGVTEEQSNVGVVTDVPTLTALNALRVAFGANLRAQGGSVDLFRPVLVKRVGYQTERGTPASRLPRVGDPLVVAGIRAVLLNTRITSQVSRRG